MSFMSRQREQIRHSKKLSNDSTVIQDGNGLIHQRRNAYCFLPQQEEVSATSAPKVARIPRANRTIERLAILSAKRKKKSV